jgi:hypothetical protein
MCTQLYAPGSTMLVKEGTVAFHSDPADPGQYFRAAQPTSKRLGAHLQLQVAQGGAVVLQSAPGCSLASLTTDGAVTVSRAPVSIAGDCTSTANAAWDVRFEVTTGRKLPATLVTVGGTLAQAGTLAITPPAGARPGAYTVFSAKAFTGNFALKLPTGYEGTYADGVLTLTAVPKA